MGLCGTRLFYRRVSTRRNVYQRFWEDLGEMVAEDGLIAMVRPLLIISAGVDRKLEFCRTEDEQSLKSGISNLNICIPTVQGLWGWIRSQSGAKRYN